ncbi:Cell wall mannoprotein 1-like protein 3 [Colletotrichum chlorophyti]|uniref:Cell wall mannoprotein 1-like protein 3 n=1 Tax=Colletotrichum chlorophyti TaxID=708187 RepID=A0A1Q8RZP3_9PEZI|nr:Cell wall mannoprotein 1-like protein 3 [Colletotrichum chlorophyti]
MHFTNVFVQALLAGSAVALPASLVSKRQLQTIQGALTSVQDSLGQLDTAVKALSAQDPQSAANLLDASNKVQSTLKQGTTQIQGAQELSLTDALTLQQSAGGLTGAVQTAVTDLVNKKPELDKLGATSVAVDQLKQQKTVAGDFSTAVVSKIPAIGQSIAQQSVDQVTQSLDQGIQQLSAGGAGAGAGGAAAPATPATPAAPAAPAAEAGQFQAEVITA